MEVNQINAYGANKVSLNSSAAEAKARAQSSSTLDMSDFLQLLSSQLANQDVMNPTDNTEFISQMAQFTSLQAMQTLSQISYSQYGASLVGKKVLVAKYDNKGDYVEDQGIVEKINYASGGNIITVNGKQYDLSSIMEVVSDTNTPIDETPSEPAESKV